jgi:hypothetical protein
MASTYSDLKIELIGTGEQVGTWGSTTNSNLGTAIEEAIVGSAGVSFSSSDVTLTLTNTNSSQTARHVRLNLTGTSGGARNLILGSGCQIDKPYIINNGLADTVTVKNTTGTGVAVPAGKTTWVFNNGTNVVDVTNHLSSLTLGSALPAGSGGTGNQFFAVSGPASTVKTFTFPNEDISVGYLNLPVNSQSTNYTLVLSDSAKTILHPTSDNNARTFTIPSNASVPYPIGTVVSFVNLANTVTIAINSDTMYLAGPGTTGSTTLDAFGVASALKVASTVWIISGNGLA